MVQIGWFYLLFFLSWHVAHVRIKNARRSSIAPYILNKKRSCRWQTARRICDKWNSVADLRVPIPHMCYHAEFGSSASKTGCGHKYGRTPEIGEPWNSALLGWEAWLTPKSATKRVRINRKEPQKWEALEPRPVGVGAWLTPWNKSPRSPHVLPRQIW